VVGTIGTSSSIDSAKTRGFPVETCAMDKGYDARHIYEGCEDREVLSDVLCEVGVTDSALWGWERPP
jgi:hypothetical protein